MKQSTTLLAALLCAFSVQAGAAVNETAATGSLDNCLLVGHYGGDWYAPTEQGMSVLSLISAPGYVSAATLLPDTYFRKFGADGKIQGLRFAVACDIEASQVFVYKAASSLTLVASQSIAGGVAHAGWNEIAFDSPASLPAAGEAVLIGFTYKETTNKYPISVKSDVLADGGWYENMTYQGQTGWYDLSSYGALSVQAYVSSSNMPEFDMVLEGLSTSSSMLQVGGQLDYSLNAYNFGLGNVSSYAIEVKFDDTVIKTFTEASGVAITASPQALTGSYVIPALTARGAHTLTATLVSVNGAAPTVGTDDDMVQTVVSVFQPTDIVNRQKYLIEEMTSHSCTYCPYGAAVLEAMHQQHDNLAIACIHGNQSSQDPFNNAEHEALLRYLGCEAFPSATFNRNYQFEDQNVSTGIGYSQAASAATMLYNNMVAASIPSFASVNIATQLEGDALTVTVSGEGGEVAQELLGDYSLTVYVLEDSLKYRQLNLGTWKSNYYHNHVIRKVVTATNGDDIQWTSASAYSNTYQVALKSDWVKEQMSVIAFLSKRQPLNNVNFADMAVTNANVVALISTHSGGQGGDDNDTRFDASFVMTPVSVTEQIMGEGASPNLKYVVGTNYATYCPCVWNVETGTVTDYDYEEGAFHAANNSGMAVGDDGDYALAILADGTPLGLYYELGEIVHEDWGDRSTGDAGSSAWAVSEDGKVIAGYYFDAAYTTTPCLWNDNGERFDLPVPTSEECGFEVSGAEARYMTPDASVIAGFVIDNMSMWPAVIWRRQADGSYKCDPVCKDYFEEDYGLGKPYMNFSPAGLSEDGKWLSLSVMDEYEGFDAPTAKIARLNLETMQLEVLTMPEPLTAQSLEASAIANDGTMLANTLTEGLVGRQGYLWPAGAASVPVSIDDVLMKVKGAPELMGNTPAFISADAKRVMGFGFNGDADIFSYVFDYNQFATAIETLVPAQAPVTLGTYNLQGVRVVNSNAPGLYLEQGKKVLKY